MLHMVTFNASANNRLPISKLGLGQKAQFASDRLAG